MFQKISLIIIGIAILIGGGFYFWVSKNKETYNAEASSKPWIEITNSSIYLLRDDGSIEKDLHTGDDISNGDTIKSSATGKATIYLPDGSTIRVDKETTVTIERVSFDEDNGTLIVRASLVTGRVWSKVVGLVTAESSWEIKTPNIGAFVKGTSFMTEHKKGVSKVYVDSHKVLVKQIDPKTKLYVDGLNVEIDEKKIADIYGLQSTTTIKVESVKKEISDDVWIKENQKEDSKLDVRIENIKKNESDIDVVREQLRGEVNILANKQKNLRAQNKTDKEILEVIRKEEAKNTLFTTPVEDTSKENKKDESVGGTGISNPPTPSSKNLEIKDLLIVSKGDVKNIEDGGNINFKVYTIMSDNSQKDVTESVVWHINGDIGYMELPGLFKGKIRDEDSESGEIKGSIGASFNDGEKIWNSKVIDVIVTPHVEETIPVGVLYKKDTLIVT